MIWSIAEGMLPGGDEAEHSRIWESAAAIRRLGRPDEITILAAWLLLDAPKHLTGEMYPIDGAQTAGPVPGPVDLP